MISWVELSPPARHAKFIKSGRFPLTLCLLPRCNEEVGVLGDGMVTGNFLMMIVYSVVIFFVVNMLVN